MAIVRVDALGWVTSGLRVRIRALYNKTRLDVVREVRELVQRLLADGPRVGGAMPVQRRQHLIVLVRKVPVHQRQLQAVRLICIKELLSSL